MHEPRSKAKLKPKPKPKPRKKATTKRRPKKDAKMGRPCKLTPSTHATIKEAIDMGATYELASLAGGITYETFLNWMKRGAAANSLDECPESEAIFLHFFQDIKGAEGRAAVRWLKVIEKAGLEGTWSAAAWKLERRYPDTFGRTVIRQEHTGKDGNPIAHITHEMTEDELWAALREGQEQAGDDQHVHDAEAGEAGA